MQLEIKADESLIIFQTSTFIFECDHSTHINTRTSWNDFNHAICQVILSDFKRLKQMNRRSRWTPLVVWIQQNSVQKTQAINILLYHWWIESCVSPLSRQAAARGGAISTNIFVDLLSGKTRMPINVLPPRTIEIKSRPEWSKRCCPLSRLYDKTIPIPTSTNGWPRESVVCRVFHFL